MLAPAVREVDDMFGYRRHSYKEATALLSAIRSSPSDLKSLLSLQELLISEITLAERRVRQSKERARTDGGGKAHYFSERAKSLQRVIYYWKTFGDAIAFLYIDRFALKHVFYNTRNLEERQHAGFLSDSLGFEREVEVARNIIETGCPCVLTGLTNTIRYGDICLLIGPDPEPIEIKSSGVGNRRSTRQRQNLRKLSRFYKTDKLDGFRGSSTVRRIATDTDCVSFENEFNQCVDLAYKKRRATVSPEEGVYYLAFAGTEADIEGAFEEISVNSVWVFYLNSLKTNQVWAPYYPFTLLIRNDDALYDFILGRLHIVVLLDVDIAKKTAKEMGYVPEIDLDADYPLVAKKAGIEGEMRISKHLLLRSALEAVSLRWIVQEGLNGFEKFSINAPDQ